MMDLDATMSPGFMEAVTETAETKSRYKVNQPQFHWNLVTRLRNQIVEKTGEAEGWRQMVLTLITEKSWEILERGNSGEPYGSLELLITEGMGLSTEEFSGAVARFAGPDMVDLMRPHLPSNYRCNNDNSVQRQADEAYKDRQAANAPEIAVRLRASDLITQADMEYLGKLNADDAHQETLQLIEDRLVELDRPPASASETDRRRFRSQVKAIIQHVVPRPETRTASKVVRLPDDADKALALLQEHLSTPQLDRLKQLLCGAASTEESTAEPCSKPRSRNECLLPSKQEAISAVRALKPGQFTITKVVMVLTGNDQISIPTVNARFSQGGTIEGNGWKFLKRTAGEIVAMGLAPKSPSWEVIQHGE